MKGQHYNDEEEEEGMKEGMKEGKKEGRKEHERLKYLPNILFVIGDV